MEPTRAAWKQAWRVVRAENTKAVAPKQTTTAEYMQPRLVDQARNSLMSRILGAAVENPKITPAQRLAYEINYVKESSNVCNLYPHRR